MNVFFIKKAFRYVERTVIFFSDYIRMKVLMLNRTICFPFRYDHLAGLITTLLDGNTNMGLEQLEEISRTMKRERIEVEPIPLRDNPSHTHTEILAKAQFNLFKVVLLCYVDIMI